MTEAEGRVAVVEYAKKWLGTPFRDQADTMGAGVDCAMLIIRSFVDTGILPPFDPRPYPPRWHLHQSRERFLEIVEQFGVQTDEVRVGNVAVYREGRCFSHGGLIMDEQTIIHAAWLRRMVITTPIFDIKLTHYPTNKERPRKIYDVWRKLQMS
jgi:cell wall-associated NlpC family hydrolase